MKLTSHKTDRVSKGYNISTLEDRKVSVAKVAAGMMGASRRGEPGELRTRPEPHQVKRATRVRVRRRLVSLATRVSTC